MVARKKYYVGIEAGGTKFVCAIASGPDDIRSRISIPTTDPYETMQKVYRFIQDADVAISGIGLASFGPIDLNADSATYGYITSTPKLPWKHYNILGELKDALHLPVGVDTDVNAAALGERRWGAAQGLNSCMYMTVGTGIGVGAFCRGKTILGLSHPEMGHMLIPRQANDDFAGVCPYHHDCFEGLASGPAIKARWGVDSALDLPPEHEAWALEANYLGMALANYVLCFMPERIVIGGGVMRQQHLIQSVRQALVKYLASYVQCTQILDDVEHYVVLPGLKENSGVLGAVALAKQAFQDEWMKNNPCINMVEGTKEREQVGA